MPDNIKALRGYIKDRVLYGDSAFFATEDAESCADEIERLRAEVEWHEEENHRLRAALHKIAEWDLTGTAISALGEKE